MKTTINIIPSLFFLFLGVILITGCDREESLEVMPIFEKEEESTNALDIYLKNNFRTPLGSNIVYKFNEIYVDPKHEVIPAKLDVIEPSMELIKKLWIAPYNKASEQGEGFLKKYFPAEIVLLGSPIVNGDGTLTGGIAEGGVRITLADLNNYNPNNKDWARGLLRLVHHEFAHIIDQNFTFNVQTFYNISGTDYTSPTTWATISKNEAIARGMITPYGTQSVGEDIAELISTIIVTDPSDFDAEFLTLVDCSTSSDIQFCLRQNEGKKRIQEKYDIVVKYLKEDVGIDLFTVRDEFLKNLN